MSLTPSTNTYNCQAITEVLSTNRNYSTDDIAWATDVICRQQYDILFLTKILVHLNRRTFIGRLSWVVNDRVRRAISEQSESSLTSALEELWPESQANISQRDRGRLEKLYMTEKTATLRVLESDQCQQGDCSALLFPCSDNNYSSVAAMDTRGNWHERTLYQKCMEQVCLYEQHEEGNKNAFIPQDVSTPSQAYILDRPDNSGQRTCYTFDQIMAMMAENKCEQTFRAMLQQRFGMEYGLYQQAQGLLTG